MLFEQCINRLLTQAGLELQAALASAVSQFRYTSVIEIAASVEYDFFNTHSLSLFSEDLTDLASCSLIAAVTLESCSVSRSGNKGLSCNVINDLCGNVCVGTIYCKTGTCCSTRNLCSDSLLSLKTSLVAVLS